MKIDLSIVLLFIGHGIRSSAILESSIEFAKKNCSGIFSKTGLYSDLDITIPFLVKIKLLRLF